MLIGAPVEITVDELRAAMQSIFLLCTELSDCTPDDLSFGELYETEDEEVCAYVYKDGEPILLLLVEDDASMRIFVVTEGEDTVDKGVPLSFGGRRLHVDRIGFA
jgi:hypothetical protein